MFLSLPVSKLILLKVETHLIIFSLCFGLLSFCPNNYLIILNLSFGLLSFYPSQQLQIAEKLFSYWLVTSPWKCCEERGKGNLKTWKLENNNYWTQIHADTRWPRTRPLKLKPTHVRQTMQPGMERRGEAPSNPKNIIRGPSKIFLPRKTFETKVDLLNPQMAVYHPFSQSQIVQF